MESARSSWRVMPVSAPQYLARAVAHPEGSQPPPVPAYRVRGASPVCRRLPEAHGRTGPFEGEGHTSRG